MQIAILAPHLRNAGGTKILFGYANEFIKKGCKVTVYVQSTRCIRRTVANVLQIGKPNWINLKARVIRIPSLQKKFINKFDHIIAGGYKEALALASWNDERGQGWYLVQHDEGLYHGSREEVDRALKAPLRKIVVSSWLRDVVREKTGLESIILLNPYDRNQFYVTPKQEHEEVRILMLDHTYLWKGTGLGLEILQKLKKKYPNIIRIGMGRRRKDAKQLYDEYYFDPKQDCIQSIYAGADIFLCASEYEGFGLPSLEAMACGTAVVTFDNGGSRDFALSGETAFVVPHTTEDADKSELSNALEDAILHKEKRNKIALQSSVFVKKLPTWEDQTNKLLQMFRL